MKGIKLILTLIEHKIKVEIISKSLNKEIEILDVGDIVILRKTEIFQDYFKFVCDTFNIKTDAIFHWVIFFFALTFSRGLSNWQGFRKMR